MRVLLVQQFDDRRVVFLEVLVEDAVLRVGALRDVEDQETAVLRYLAVEVPILVILSLIDQRVLVLGRA